MAVLTMINALQEDVAKTLAKAIVLKPVEWPEARIPKLGPATDFQSSVDVCLVKSIVAEAKPVTLERLNTMLDRIRAVAKCCSRDDLEHRKLSQGAARLLKFGAAFGFGYDRGRFTQQQGADLQLTKSMQTAAQQTGLDENSIEFFNEMLSRFQGAGKRAASDYQRQQLKSAVMKLVLRGQALGYRFVNGRFE